MPKGVHNGKRGRKRSALPPALLSKLGPIPIGKPLKQARWWQDAIGVVTLGVLEGQPWRKLLEQVRASAHAVGRSLSHEIVFEAARVVEEDRGLKLGGGRKAR